MLFIVKLAPCLGSERELKMKMWELSQILGELGSLVAVEIEGVYVNMNTVWNTQRAGM